MRFWGENQCVLISHLKSSLFIGRIRPRFCRYIDSRFRGNDKRAAGMTKGSNGRKT